MLWKLSLPTPKFPAYVTLPWHLLLLELQLTLRLLPNFILFPLILVCKSYFSQWMPFILTLSSHRYWLSASDYCINLEFSGGVMSSLQKKFYRIMSLSHFLIHKVICFWGLFFTLISLTFVTMVSFLSFQYMLRTFGLLWLCLFWFLLLQFNQMEGNISLCQNDDSCCSF